MIEKGIELGLRLSEVIAPETTAALESCAERLLQSAGVTFRGAGLSTIETPVVNFSGSALPEQAIGTALRPVDLVAHEFGHTPPDLVSEIATNTARRLVPGMTDETILEGIATPQSMTPKAFKLLNPNGTSPGAPEVPWSLPRLKPDGTWTPGQWQEPVYSNSPIMSLTRGRNGLFVTDDPTNWHTLGPNLHVFEAQIGDLASVRAWHEAPSYDFAAQRVRLLRQLSADEIKSESPRWQAWLKTIKA